MIIITTITYILHRDAEQKSHVNNECISSEFSVYGAPFGIKQKQKQCIKHGFYLVVATFNGDGHLRHMQKECGGVRSSETNEKRM